MTKLANLDRVAHRNLRVEEEQAFSACKDITMCAVSIDEISRLVIEYPVVFTKDTSNDQFVCVALFSVSPEKNLFWKDGRWDSFSVPLNVGRQPFSVGLKEAPPEGGSPELVTCIDLDNPGVQVVSGEALFDADGNYTPYLKRKMNMLAELVDGEQRSRAFTQRAAELGLIDPMQIELKAPGGEPRRISGLYAIDARKLRALEAGVVAELNASGHLHALYAMVSSLGHLQILARRATPDVIPRA